MEEQPSAAYNQLIQTAIEARNHAYNPYSRFAVGAAAQTDSGQVFAGCNIENAAYPLTICAERVALFRAYAAGERGITALAVVTPTADVASPCGACRQVMIELAPHSTLLLANTHGLWRITTPHELLPHSFGPTQLGESQQL
jgi:cytidine deaminase